MHSSFSLGISVALLASATAAIAAPRDACSILTPAQVSAAVGASVGAGESTSTGRTCTWKATDGGAGGVTVATLFLQTGASYEGGRKLAAQVSAQAMVPVSGVGDSAYYFVTGTAVGLLARKGDQAFKAAVYGSAPVEKKKAIEKALARQVVSRL